MITAKHNPFSVDRVTKFQFRFPEGDSWDQFLNRIEENCFRGAIVGLQGSGKSTLLRRLQQRLIAKGFPTWLVHLDHDGRLHGDQVNEIDRQSALGKIILLDSAEKLNLWNWRKVSKATQGSGLIITVHRACKLPTLIETSTSNELLGELYEKLEAGSCGVDSEELSTLFAKHHGNIRDVFRELYDLAANSPGSS